MSENPETSSRNRIAWAQRRSFIVRPISALTRSSGAYGTIEIIAPITVGIVLGSVLVFARGLPTRWSGLVILATMAPTIALVINNLSKLLLLVVIIDIPLGLDIALADKVGHKGGPNGFVISLMTIALAAGYARWIISKSKVQSYKKLTVPALVFFFTMLMSAFQAVEVWYTITQLFLEAQFLLLFLYVSNHVKTWNIARLIFTTLVICLFLESVLMILQYTTDFQLSFLSVKSQATGSNIESAAARISGTMGSPNTAATYVAASLVITFAAYLTDGRLVNKRLCLLAFFPGLLALLATQSRSGLIAFGLAMSILIARAMRRRIGVRALLLFFVVIIVLGGGFSTQIIERFTKSGQVSAMSRVWHAKLAFNILEDHMFTGIGLSNVWFVRKDYLPLELIAREDNIIHNKYLSVWAETGLFGFLSFVWLLLSAGRYALRAAMNTENAHVSIAITGLLGALSIYIYHMTSATFLGRGRMQFFWLILALIAATAQLAEKTKDLKDPFIQSKKTASANLALPAGSQPGGSLEKVR